MDIVKESKDTSGIAIVPTSGEDGPGLGLGFTSGSVDFNHAIFRITDLDTLEKRTVTLRTGDSLDLPGNISMYAEGVERNSAYLKVLGD